ncbi:MAG: NhaA family Na+:H+ antiporter [Sphingobacteriales bacterium]|jgi:NhaA family Na+:H+ antiporter
MNEDPIKKTTILDKVLTPFQRFTQTQASGGIVLIICSVLAMVLANSPWAEDFIHFWEMKFSIGFEGAVFSKTIHHWINDGLMAIFFFVVGLEIKREIREGELSTVKAAAMPLVAALGGMVIPALLFVTLIDSEAAQVGWGIPMATDIAFSLGVLSLLGKRVPLAMKIFLTAFAIVDDIGAVLVIALFYSGSIQIWALVSAFGILAILLLFNRMKIKRIGFYVVPGVILWYLMLQSGIHATLAGILVAMTIPSASKVNITMFIQNIKKEMTVIKKKNDPEKTLLSHEQLVAIDHIEDAAENFQSPLQKLEHHLHGYVAFIIMPIFALANAGVHLSGAGGTGNLSLIVILALVVGKPLGILTFCWFAVKTKLAKLPHEINWTQLLGIGLLGGIGFTMSLFISNLAFTDAVLISQAKTGILIASLLAGIGGYLILKLSLKGKEIDEH